MGVRGLSYYLGKNYPSLGRQLVQNQDASSCTWIVDGNSFVHHFMKSVGSTGKFLCDEVVLRSSLYVSVVLVYKL